MDSDRELLEAAARAYWGDEIDDVVSIRWLEDDQAIGYTHADNQDHNGCDREFVWNPLEDDGDALRLAVKLQMDIAIFEKRAVVELGNDRLIEEGDRYAATRRAIVRAAAALGNAVRSAAELGRRG